MVVMLTMTCSSRRTWSLLTTATIPPREPGIPPGGGGGVGVGVDEVGAGLEGSEEPLDLHDVLDRWGGTRLTGRTRCSRRRRRRGRRPPTLRASHQRDHGDQGQMPYATIRHLPSFIRATDGRPLYRAELEGV